MFSSHFYSLIFLIPFPIIALCGPGHWQTIVDTVKEYFEVAENVLVDFVR